MNGRRVRRVGSKGLGLLAVLVLIVGVLPVGVAAQDEEPGLVSDTEFVLSGGGSVTWDEPWEVDENESGFNADIPGYVVSLFTGLEGSGRSRTYDAQFYLFTSIALITPEDVRDSLLERNETNREEGFEILDQGEDEDSAYSLTRYVGPDDETWGSFHFVAYSPAGSELYSTEMITNVADYEETLTSAQEEIEIEGEAAFEGVDAEELGATLTEGVDGSREQDTETETETETETDTETETQTETETETDTETDTDTETETETETETQRSRGRDEIDLEQEELGLVSETEYESPQHGYTVEWDESWTLDEEDEDPLSSDEENEEDRIALINEDEGAFLTIFGFPSLNDTPEDAVDFFATTYIEENLSDQAEVLLDEADEERGAVVIRDETEDGIEVIQYFEFFVIDDGDTMIQLTFTVAAETFEDAYASIEDEITIDGDPVLTTFDAEEVLDAA